MQAYFDEGSFLGIRAFVRLALFPCRHIINSNISVLARCNHLSVSKADLHVVQRCFTHNYVISDKHWRVSLLKKKPISSTILNILLPNYWLEMSEDDGFVGSARSQPQPVSLAQKFYGCNGRTVIVERLHERVVIIGVEDVDQSVTGSRGQKAVLGWSWTVLQAQNFSVVRLDPTDFLKGHHVVNSNVALAVARGHVLAVRADSDRPHSVLAVVILRVVWFRLLLGARSRVIDVNGFD